MYAAAGKNSRFTSLKDISETDVIFFTITWWFVGHDFSERLDLFNSLDLNSAAVRVGFNSEPLDMTPVT